MKNNSSIFNQELFLNSLKETMLKLKPTSLIRNPVIFVTAICSCLSSYSTIVHWSTEGFFLLQISIWLWFTVFFALFSEALAEGRGKAQADSLKKIKGSLKARQLIDGKETVVDASSLEKGDLVVCTTGDLIPGDGEVIEGIATIDESAITGESAPVIRESGGDRSAVTAGTRVLSDRIVVRLTVEKGQTFIDRMIKLVEGAQRKKTPNEIALSLLLSALTLVFVLALSSLKIFNDYLASSSSPEGLALSLPLLGALFVCLIPTTIGGLLSAIGISGMDRLIRKNVIATSGRAVEAAGDVNVLMMDKTGTITFGNRMAEQFFPARPDLLEALTEASYISSLADETPEGRSIVDLALKMNPQLTQLQLTATDEVVAFSAHTRMSGIDRTAGLERQAFRKGASDSIAQWIKEKGGDFSQTIRDQVMEIAKKGGTPLVVSRDNTALGVIYLKDIIKPGMTQRFKQLRQMGIRTVMITGDNPITAAAIAAEAGVDDFMAEASPEDKLARIRAEQASGYMVAMTGDGTNDAPALAQADVGVAMNTGTQAAREAGNMVDLDSNPTKLIDIVEVGKQLLMTRGALTTFSVTNDVAKYFAILPALFVTLFATKDQPGPLAQLNLMNLHSPQSAILSAVIFNALIIVFLIPIALRGVKIKALSPQKILLQNVLIYGVGGLILPFAGIKLIDWLIVSTGLIS